MKTCSYFQNKNVGKERQKLKLIEFMSVCTHLGPVLISLKEGYNRPNKLVFKAPVKEKKGGVVNGIDLLENVPPRTENEVLP